MNVMLNNEIQEVKVTIVVKMGDLEITRETSVSPSVALMMMEATYTTIQDYTVKKEYTEVNMDGHLYIYGERALRGAEF